MRWVIVENPVLAEDILVFMGWWADDTLTIVFLLVLLVGYKLSLSESGYFVWYSPPYFSSSSLITPLAFTWALGACLRIGFLYGIWSYRVMIPKAFIGSPTQSCFYFKYNMLRFLRFASFSFSSESSLFIVLNILYAFWSKSIEVGLFSLILVLPSYFKLFLIRF